MEPLGADPVVQTALRSLHDIVLPEPISWLPQTWGWALVATILVASGLVLAVNWIRRYRANAYRREAKAILVEIRRLLDQPATRRDGIRQLGELLKRTALAAWARNEVASLSQEEWVRFLNKHCNSTDTRALGWLLQDIEYHSANTLAHLPSSVRDDILVATRDWIERHNVSA